MKKIHISINYMQCVKFLGMYLGVPFSKQHKDRMYLREGNFSLNCLYKGHQHSLHVVALVCVIKRAVTLSQTGTYKKSSSSTYMLKMSKKKKKRHFNTKVFCRFSPITLLSWSNSTDLPSLYQFWLSDTQMLLVKYFGNCRLSPCL